eukprot:gene21221-21078_t
MLRIACCAVLVGVALGEFGPKEPENDVCKLPKDYCEKAVEAGEDCITPLFYGLDYLRLIDSSDLLFNGLGNFEFCTAPPFQAWPNQAEMQVCPLRFMSGGFALATYGVCLPASCKGDPLNSFMPFIGHKYKNKDGSFNPDINGCFNSTAQVKARIDLTIDCFKGHYKEVCPTMDPDGAKPGAETLKWEACIAARNNSSDPLCCMPWHGFETIMDKSFTVLSETAQALSAVGEAEFSCGLGEYKPFGKDAAAGIVFTLIAIIASMVVYSSYSGSVTSAGKCLSIQSDSALPKSVNEQPIYEDTESAQPLIA